MNFLRSLKGNRPKRVRCHSQAYPDAVAAGAALLDLQDGPLNLADVDDGAEWLQRCADAGTDPAASAKVAESFSDADSI